MIWMSWNGYGDTCIQNNKIIFEWKYCSVTITIHLSNIKYVFGEIVHSVTEQKTEWQPKWRWCNDLCHSRLQMIKNCYGRILGISCHGKSSVWRWNHGSTEPEKYTLRLIWFGGSEIWSERCDKVCFWSFGPKIWTSTIFVWTSFSIHHWRTFNRMKKMG